MSIYDPVWLAIKAAHLKDPTKRVQLNFDPVKNPRLSTLRQGIKDAKAKDETFEGSRYYLDFVELQPRVGYGFAVKLKRIYKPESLENL
jgi:hypothetical protein